MVAALALDAADTRRLAFYALLAAIPLAAAAALALFGELVELPGRARGAGLARFEAACAFSGLVFVVAAAASRAPEALSPAGQSGLVAATLVFAAAAVTHTLRTPARASEPQASVSPHVAADQRASAPARAA